MFPNIYFQAVIVREASGRVRAYRDGVLKVDVANDGGDFAISAANFLRFFQDDAAQPNEASAGNVARIRLYDAPLTTAQIQALDREPNQDTSGSQVIAFGSGRDGNSEIYTMNADGSLQRRLTNNTVSDSTPDWSPNGQKIVFRRTESNFIDQIWMMNSDGSGQTRLSNPAVNEHFARFSPNSTKIVFARCDSGFICDLWLMNSDGTGQTQITNTPGVDEDDLDWSPDGTKITFSRYTDADGLEIYTINADGTNLQRLTNNAAAIQDYGSVWSPDGTKIAFTSKRDGNFEIYTMNPDGSNQTRLTNNIVNDTNPVWSPDSSKICFSSFRDTVSGNFNAFAEAYVMNADGTSPVRITFNNQGDGGSDWRGQSVSRRTQFDFDGDSKADLAVFRPSSGIWYIQQSTAGFTGVQFGATEDKLVVADYDVTAKLTLQFIVRQTVSGICSEANWDLPAFNSVSQPTCQFRQITMATGKRTSAFTAATPGFCNARRKALRRFNSACRTINQFLMLSFHRI